MSPIERSAGGGGGGGGTGVELDYVEITSNVVIAGTTDATATTVITGNSVTYSGSQRVMIQYWLGTQIAAGFEIVFVLYDGATDLGRTSFAGNTGGTPQDCWVPGTRILTPSAGAHTFSIRAWKTGAGAVQVYAGAGGAGVTMPAFYRITTA